MPPLRYVQTPGNPVTALLGLGASLGDRVQNLRDALERLQQSGVRVVKVSPVYESPHMGIEPGDADRYPSHLNIVALVETSLAPESLLALIQAAEAAGGRVRERRWGPRTIDIDVLTYDSLVSAESALTLPHPGIGLRAFVAAPLVDIDPDFRLADGTPLCDRMSAEPLRSQGILRTDLSAWPVAQPDPGSCLRSGVSSEYLKLRHHQDR